MDTTKFIWLDGKFVPWNNAKIHVLTHALHYGSSVFEGIRCYATADGPQIFRLHEHMRRFLHSAKVMRMNIPYTEDELVDIIKETVKKNKLPAGYIRPIAFYAYGKMGLGIKGAPVSVAVACWPWGAYLGEKPIHVLIPPVIRNHPRATDHTAKIGGFYANSILAGEFAREHGFDEALMVDYKGNIAEGPGENFFMVKKKVLYTPKLGSILPGITRDAIMIVARNEKLKVVERPLSIRQVLSADEAFFTGTAAELSPIGWVNKKRIGTGDMGPVTKYLKTRFVDITAGRDPRYIKWLTKVE